MGEIGWGILGAGKIATAFAADIIGAGMHVSAVGARDATRAADFGARFGVSRAYGSYEELVADPAVDVVYVATPQSFHAEQALLAIRAGKAVLIEKSFTRTLAEAEKVAAEARSAGAFVMEAMWSRFLPSMVELRSRIAGGLLGDVVEVHASHHQKLSAAPGNRHYDPALGGGALLDLGVYPISLAVELLGVPLFVSGRGVATDRAVDTRASGVLDHGYGRLSTFSTAMDLPGPIRASVHGTAGFIEFDPWWFTNVGWTLWDAGRPGTVVERFEAPSSPLRGMHLQAREVERCLASGLLESPVMPLQESVNVMGVLEELERQVVGDAD
jgi:predicted dehydrogenase